MLIFALWQQLMTVCVYLLGYKSRCVLDLIPHEDRRQREGAHIYEPLVTFETTSGFVTLLFNERMLCCCGHLRTHLQNLGGLNLSVHIGYLLYI